MDFDSRLKNYEDRYKHELDTREKIESRIKTPFSMFLIVFGLIAYLVKEVISKNLTLNWFFWCLCIFACIFFLTAIAYFIRAIYGYHYLLIPTPKVLEEYYSSILEEYERKDLTKAEGWTNEAFKEYLFDSYVNFTSQNTQNNDSKSLNISNCLLYLIISFILICASYMPFFAESLELKDTKNVRQTNTAEATNSKTSKKPTATEKIQVEPTKKSLN